MPPLHRCYDLCASLAPPQNWLGRRWRLKGGRKFALVVQRSLRRLLAHRSLKGGGRKVHASPWSQNGCTWVDHWSPYRIIPAVPLQQFWLFNEHQGSCCSSYTETELSSFGWPLSILVSNLVAQTWHECDAVSLVYKNTTQTILIGNSEELLLKRSIIIQWNLVLVCMEG